MQKRFTLEYWIAEGWIVGRLKEIPGISSQGQTLEELEQNIRKAYQLMIAEDATSVRSDKRIKELLIEV